MFALLVTGCSTNNDPSKGIVEIKPNYTQPLVFPIWSPDGDKIIATNISELEHQIIIFLIDLETYKKNILYTINGYGMAQSWSSDGSAIAVSISSSISFKDDGIWIFNLFNNTNYFVGKGESATWSPDGKKLAINSCSYSGYYYPSIATLRIVDTLTGNEELLFSKNDCLKLAYISWSKDNKYIIFSYAYRSNSSGDLNSVVVINLATKQVKEIMKGNDWSPFFSPAGDRFVYVHDDSLQISNTSGTCQSPINLPDIDIIGDVSWSPDGTKWAMSGLGKIYILDITKYFGSQINWGCQ